jgi:predicted transcriptional regulator of viral defense system
MPSITDRLFAIAEGQDGFFTTRQAAHEGVSKQAIIQAERRGRVERYHRGVYRLRPFPFNAGISHYWEALLWPHARSEIEAVLSHQTALRLHGLSDVNPEHVHISVPRRIRIQRSVPSWMRVHPADIAQGDIDYVEGLAVTTIPKTLEDVLDAPKPQIPLIQDAIHDAERRGIPIPPAIKQRAGLHV